MCVPNGNTGNERVNWNMGYILFIGYLAEFAEVAGLEFEMG